MPRWNTSLVERRQREAQREAVEDVLPDTGDVSVLRMANGEVLVYDELGGKRRAASLRAAVLPDGEILWFESERFRRVGD